jgi:nitrogen regulatory protein PII
MKKIEAIVQSLELQQVMDALVDIGIDGMTITDILGDDSEQGRSVTDRSNEDVGYLLPEVRFDLVVSNQRSMEVVDTIAQAVHTSQFGVGNIFVYEIADAIRISNGDRGDAALRAPAGKVTPVRNSAVA